MLLVVTVAGCLPVALLVKSAQLLNAVNSVSMVFLLFFCCIIALLPFSPTPNTGACLAWCKVSGSGAALGCVKLWRLVPGRCPAKLAGWCGRMPLVLLPAGSNPG
jgi:hypothetical protein